MGDCGEFDYRGWMASDDVKGGSLPAHLVHSARLKELKYLQDRKVYEYASVADAIRCTGKKPLGLKWIDTNKGDNVSVNIRSRLVCTEVRPKGVEAIFSATPPLESLRILINIASHYYPPEPPPSQQHDPMCITLADISRAHFYALSTRPTFIRLPPEDPKAGVHGVCGRLLRTMYGTLDAAERWGEHYAAVLTKAGFTRGRASPCHFHH